MTSPQTVITIIMVLLHHTYHPRGITAKFSPIPAVITAVTTVLTAFPLYL